MLNGTTASELWPTAHQKKKKHLRIRLFFGLVDVWVKSDGLGIAMFWTQVSKRHIVQENVERRERNPWY